METNSGAPIQLVIGVAAFILSTVLLPWVFGRYMGAAPWWVQQTLVLACVLLSTVVILFSNPIWSRVRSPSQFPLSSTLIVTATIATIVGSAWRLFVAQPIYRLEINASTTGAQYPSTVLVAGLSWIPNFTAVRIAILGSEYTDYTDVHLVLRLNEPIVRVIQTDPILPGVQLRPAVAIHAVEQNHGAVFRTIHLATTGGYKLICDRIPKGDALHLLVVIGKPATARTLQMGNGEQDTAWAATEAAGPLQPLRYYFEAPRLAKTVSVQGEFRIGPRTIAVNDTLTVAQP